MPSVAALLPWISVATLIGGVVLTLGVNVMPTFPGLRTVLAFSGMMLCFGGMQVL